MNMHNPPRGPKGPNRGQKNDGGGPRGRRPRVTPKGRQVDTTALTEIEALLAERPRRRDLLIEHLHLIQDKYGHLSAPHLTALAQLMRMSLTEVYEVATFYSHHTRDWLGMNDSAPDRAAYPPVRWPMVRTHPGSRRKLLWVDNKVTEISGMSVPEGRALAHELLEHIGQREHVYSHAWRPGDVVMWDNRSVLHRGRRFDLGERREMRRVSTVDDSASLGEQPSAEATPRPEA